ncbi:DDE superfamily endonuclease [Ceratobasidium sp. AG-Ba]|nr:DDE superfamily endonuclease [Ceratobasidium sp. AG-Ba]
MVLQAQAVHLRRQTLHGSQNKRFGPRGPYRKRDWVAEIDQIFQNESARNFKSWLRIDRTSFDRLLHLIKDNKVFQSDGKKPQLPVHYQLAVYLIRYGYTTGTKTGSKINVSEGSVYKCCKRVTHALRALRSAYVRWPTNEEKQDIKLYYQECGFPGAIGSVDGTYIQLLDKPKFRPMAYYCRKKFWAVSMMVVASPDGRILFYDLGWPGSMADVTIWKQCHLWQHRDAYLARSEWLFADKGYSLSQYMMMPFQEHELRIAEPPEKRKMKKWNKAFASQRIVVEHTFGRLKKRFGYLRGIPGRHMGTIYRVIESLVILHNILLDFGDLAEDLGPAEAAQVMHGHAEFHLRHERHYERTPPEATSSRHHLLVGQERRQQLLNYWADYHYA